jgi:uncharacterized membrane protein YgdD (TMEM256/DUF423 family)
MNRSFSERFALLTGVALGALGAHRLEATLAERGMTHAWETGARYHMIHAVALLALASLGRDADVATQRRLGWAAWCWTIGILLFSGSLYPFALGGPHALMYVTPFGGLALLAGWVFVLAAGMAKRSTDAR